MQQDKVQASYSYCLNIVKNHYENFPVASWLLPAKIRKPISAIYAFARTADDIADEGTASNDERLKQLDEMAQKLDMIRYGKAIDDPVFIALADTIENFDLPVSLLHDLLTAFRMDVTVHRYQSFEALLDYCKYSANPIGQLLLHLFNSVSVQNIAYSDAVCSALQIINFLQDIEQDYVEQGRIYLPLNELEKFSLDETTIRDKILSQELRLLIDSLLVKVQQMLDFGKPLGQVLPGRVGFEIKLTVVSANRIIQKLSSHRTDVFTRPRLKWQDALWIFNHTLFNY
ncbi:Squalene synthase [hydrothermal vent metagenome]|uniref:Squalene synthase n=1 Tax=hydrothermal vent metagenome TaxID=652676 RepID=A0A3B1A5W2_9ZZZZ